MRSFLSWHRHIKQPSTIGFCLSLGAHILAGAWLLGAFSQDKIASTGNAQITVSLASINTHAPQKAYSKPPKPKKPHHKRPHHKKPHKSKHPIPTEEMLQEKPTQQQEDPTESTQARITEGEELEQSASNQDSQGSTQESLAYRDGVDDEFYRKVQEAIAKKHDYPQLARIRGIQGTVEVEFILYTDGSIDGIRVLRSNTGDILNKQAIRTIKEAHKSFPTPPKAVRLRIPIHYGLSES